MNSLNIFYIIITSVLIFTGLLMYFKPPKEINSFFGFRTMKSGKSQRNWDIAQKLCGKYMIIIGGLSSIISAISMILLTKGIISYDLAEYMMLIPVILLIIMIFVVQRKLPD